jgi:hypothetical protein
VKVIDTRSISTFTSSTREVDEELERFLLYWKVFNEFAEFSAEYFWRYSGIWAHQ